MRDVAVSVPTTALSTSLLYLNFAAATERLRRFILISASAPYGMQLPFPFSSFYEFLVNEVDFELSSEIKLS